MKFEDERTETPWWTDEEIDIETIDEAIEFIEHALENGFRPIVTVPAEFEDEIKAGLRPHTTWIEGLNIIAGKLVAKPYLPENEDRIIVRVKDIDPRHIHPRMTKDNHFRGVVVLDGPIPAESLEIRPAHAFI